MSDPTCQSPDCLHLLRVQKLLLQLLFSAQVPGNGRDVLHFSSGPTMGDDHLRHWHGIPLSVEKLRLALPATSTDCGGDAFFFEPMPSHLRVGSPHAFRRGLFTFRQTKKHSPCPIEIDGISL